MQAPEEDRNPHCPGSLINSFSNVQNPGIPSETCVQDPGLSFEKNDRLFIFHHMSYVFRDIHKVACFLLFGCWIS